MEIKIIDNSSLLAYCFGYSRKSPDDKKSTDSSIDNQNDLIEITCKSNNWNLVSTEEDRDISGGDRSRKGINKQIEASIEFKKNNPETNVYILTKDSKRFARDSSFFKDTIERLNAHGVKVFSIMKNNFLDPSDIADRLLSVVDEQIIFDAKKYAELNQELKKEKNMPCIPAPFGYKYGANKNWIVNRKEAKIIIKVLSDYILKLDYKAILKKNSITKGKYYRILRNARNGIYSGFIAYDKKIKDSNGNIIRVENIKYSGNHESIISEELWKEVNGKKVNEKN